MITLSASGKHLSKEGTIKYMQLPFSEPLNRRGLSRYGLCSLVLIFLGNETVFNVDKLVGLFQDVDKPWTKHPSVI